MGQDKTMLLVDGTPLWRRQAELLQRLKPCEFFISGKPRPEWAGFELIEDDVPGLGPLGGIVSCLRKSGSPLLVVLAVDMPRMPEDYLRHLLQAGRGVVPKIGEFFEPLAAVYPKAALPIAERRLASGQLSLQGLAAEMISQGLARVEIVREVDRALFANWNHPQDVG